MQDEFDIVVVGGGLVGLAAASALAMHVKKVALIEKNLPQTQELSKDYALRVSAISPGSIELLEALGVWPQVLAKRAFPYKRMRVWDGERKGEIEFLHTEVGRNELGYIVENNVLQAALEQRIDAQKNITQFREEELDNLSAFSSNVVLSLASGKNISAKLVLGADGQHSRLRERLDIVLHRTLYAQCGVVCTVHTEYDHEQTAWQCFTEFGPLAFLPLDGYHCSVVWSVDENKSEEWAELDEGQFGKMLSEHSDHRLGEVSVCSKRVAFPLSGAQADSYVAQRCLLLGDAAHVVHPLAGLGVNLGFQDVLLLKQLLADSERELGSERVLRRFERARKTECASMQRALEGIDQLFRQQRPEIGALRSVGLKGVNRCPPIKRLFMRHAMGLS